MSRFLALWMPFFSTEQLRRDSSALYPASRKLVLHATEGNRRVVTAVDASACRAGIGAGMTLAHARALDPDLLVIEHDREKDREALARLTAWGLWMSPLVAADAPDGLFADLSGCTHLFGGETAFLERLCADLRSFGHNAFACISDSAAASRAIARSGQTAIIAPGAHKAALRALPCKSLPIDEALALRLKRLGLETIGACFDLPRAPLAKRFGSAFLDCLDQAAGLRPMPLSFVQQRIGVQCARSLFEPIGTAEAIATVIEALVPEICAQLLERGEGARLVDFLCTRVDNTIQAVRVGTSDATCDPARLIRLLCDQIPQIEPGFGIEAVQLVIVQSAPIRQHETALPGYGETHGTWPATLLDRLANAPGLISLARLHCVDAAWPEEARHLSLHGAVEQERHLDIAPRPVVLLDRAIPIEVTALLPDGAPRQFRLGRMLHRIVCAEGPERIAGAWWQDPGAFGITRDYWTIETEKGQRLWLYRLGDGVHDWTGSGQWHLQGLF